MRLAPRALFAGLISALALSVAACGSSSELLSGHQASSLKAGLNQIHAALNQHDCSTAQSEAIALKSRVANLPTSVNGTVRRSLANAASQLEQLVSKDCAPVTTTAHPQTSPPTTATTTTTTTTTTATTATNPPPKKKPKPHTTPATTPTPTGTTTEPAPGPGKGNGNGNGVGNGNGQGGGDPTTPTTPTTQGNS